MAASNLVVRVGTAVVGVPAILALLYWAPPWAFFVVVAGLGAGIGGAELFAMTHPGDKVAQAVGVLTSLAAACCMYFLSSDPRALLTLMVVLPLLGVLVPLWRLGSIPTAGLRITANCFGPLYVGGMMTTLAIMRRDQPGYDGPGFALLAFGFAWLSDTGGYFAGRLLGKHKLYEAVSPKKTIEGSIGGLAGAMAWGVVAHLWFLKSLPLLDAVVLGCVAGFLGQLGDLGESLLKRAVGVKDSGSILPGHGGILDRVDALMLTSTVTFLYTLWR